MKTHEITNTSLHLGIRADEISIFLETHGHELEQVKRDNWKRMMHTMYNAEHAINVLQKRCDDLKAYIHHQEKEVAYCRAQLKDIITSER